MEPGSRQGHSRSHREPVRQRGLRSELLRREVLGVFWRGFEGLGFWGVQGLQSPSWRVLGEEARQTPKGCPGSCFAPPEKAYTLVPVTKETQWSTPKISSTQRPPPLPLSPRLPFPPLPPATKENKPTPPKNLASVLALHPCRKSLFLRLRDLLCHLQSQRAQYPLIKEYTLNYRGRNIMV